MTRYQAGGGVLDIGHERPQRGARDDQTYMPLTPMREGSGVQIGNRDGVVRAKGDLSAALAHHGGPA